MNLLKSILQSKKFFLFITCLTCCYVFLQLKVFSYQSIHTLDETKFVGQVIKIKETDYGYSVIFKDEKEKLMVYFEEFNYRLGDVLEIEGDLEIPKNNTVLNNFNYKQYLNQNGIFYILKPKTVKKISENKNIIYQLKTNLLNYMDKFKSKNYLKSFILGDTSYLGNELYESYQINGICHLLAIGSMHVTFLSFLFLKILKKLKLNFTVSNIILFSFLFFFLLLTDYPISIVRVCLYKFIAFINQKFKLEFKPLKIFIFVVIITLLLNPYFLYHKGFLYSYMISFLLILNKDKLTGNYFIKLVKISGISFLGSLPFTIYFNYEVNLFSIFYNLFYVPYFNLIVFPLSLLTLLFPVFDTLFYQIMEVANYISYFLNNFAWGIIILKKISIIFLSFYLIIITITIKQLLIKRKKWLIVLLGVFCFHYYINDIFPEDYFIVIDINQGDSTLFYSKNKAILVDTGGIYKKNISEKTITMLKSLGIRKIDNLFLTHGDYDHMGDSIYFVNNFKVLNVVFNSNEFNDLEKKLEIVLKKKKINYCIAYKNMTYTINNLKIKMLNQAYDNENDSSLVMYILFKNHRILMMGDASTKVERDLLENYNLAKIDFLKVGHHGSKTSTSKEFIETINPKIALISVGLNNIYHHPNKEVIQLLESKNIKIYKTSEVGSIIINLKKRVTIKCLAP